MKPLAADIRMMRRSAGSMLAGALMGGTESVRLQHGSARTMETLNKNKIRRIDTLDRIKSLILSVPFFCTPLHCFVSSTFGGHLFKFGDDATLW
jgi:hypothetical protein